MTEIKSRYPYWRLLIFTLVIAIILSRTIHKLALANWWMHPVGIAIGIVLYITLLIAKGKGLIRFEKAELQQHSELGIVAYYWRLVSVAFVLTSPFELIASLTR